MMKVPLILLLAVAAGVPSGPGADDRAPPAAIEAAGLRQLLTIRRGVRGPAHGRRIGRRDARHPDQQPGSAKLFILTENQERADAVLRGPPRTWCSPRCTPRRTASNAARQSGRTNRRQHADFARRYRRRRRGGERSGPFGRASSRSRGRRAPGEQRRGCHLATTEESLGAKFHGASVDVADKITARLKEDFGEARKLK